MRVFLSYPATGLYTCDKRLARRYKSELIAMFDDRVRFEHIEFVDNSDCEVSENDNPLYYLSKALEKMDKCDAIVFHRYWMYSKGSILLRKAAEAYGLKIIDQEDLRQTMYNIFCEVLELDPATRNRSVVHAVNILQRNEIYSIIKLCSLTPEKLSEMKGMGKVTIDLTMNVINKLRENYPELA